MSPTRIHLDHNATTPLRPEVRAHWLERQDELGGNPSSIHASGRAARAVLDQARERAAAALRVDEDELVFTSGGAESNNLALFGALAGAPLSRALVTTAIEHSTVLAPADELERSGRPVVRVRVDREGRPDPAEMLELVRRRDAALVSMIAANNEIGTENDLAALGAALAELGERRPIFHSDCVQLLGRLPFDLRGARLDLASFSVHKIGGPLGVGLLYRRRGVPLAPRTFGGGQENGLRPGTENVPAISAAALAIELAVEEQPEFHARTQALSRDLWSQLQARLPAAELHGPPLSSSARLPNTLNVSLAEDAGRLLVARLDLEGLEVSAGSACASGSIEPSHVLLALGLAPERARTGLRLSLGRTTTAQDVHSAVEILSRTIAATR
jgi:cysteine desulfurase